MSRGKEGKMDSRALEKKLSVVRESAEEIQTLSRWCLQHKNHHHSIIQAWSRAVRKAKVPHRLTLFYVCNDIVQNARRKKIPDMVQHFGTAIKEAAPLVRDEKIRPKIVRIFNIWDERGIYDAKLVAEFTEIVENVGTVNASENEIVLSSFQPVQLVEGIRTVVAYEKSTESLRNDLKNQDFSLTDDEINQLRQTVKERGTSRERMEEFEEAVVALECYIASVQKEIEERTQVVTLLEQAEIFYETQRGEAKMVANAYKNFGNRVKGLKTKLMEKMKSLPDPSPVPSPTPDAPSPENSDDEDLALPDGDKPGLDSFLNSSAFAELAKDALSSSGDLDRRLSVLNDSNESLKGFPEMSMSAVLEREIKDVHSGRDDSDDDIIEIPQKEFPARDSVERQISSSSQRSRSSMEIWDVSERRRSVESHEPSRTRESEESRQKSESRSDSRDHMIKPPSRWDMKDSKNSMDVDSRRENHDLVSSNSSSNRRDTQEHKEHREEWERDTDHREYSSSRERRSSRSSRESRDSHEPGSAEPREVYRSSSWDHVGSDRDSYSHKTRDRDYSSIQIPKDLKPMSAAELLDTFGKVFSKNSSSGSSSVASPSPFEPVKAPPTPVVPPQPVQPPIPDLSRPPPSLSIPLPPTNPPPPAAESPSPYTPIPSASNPQTPYTPTVPSGSNSQTPYTPTLPPVSNPPSPYTPTMPPRTNSQTPYTPTLPSRTNSQTPYTPTLPSRTNSQTPYTPTKPLYQPSFAVTPESTSKPPYCPPLPPPPPPPPPPCTTSTPTVESLPFSFNSGTSTWVPPPPPPPPPPELMENEMPQSESDYEPMNRNFTQSWSDYDDESDDRNWGEPPGNEELEALHSDTPPSPPSFEKSFTGSLAPPPLPPAFCTPRSNLRELVSEDQRTNLVSIQPSTTDNDYRCYNYHSLSEEPKPVPAPTPSIRSLFPIGMDQDLRVKKHNIKPGKTESGSDMDISNSDSENNMDISDDSVKEGMTDRNEGRRVKRMKTKSRNKDSVSGNQSNKRREKTGDISDEGVLLDSGEESKASKQSDCPSPKDNSKNDGEPITSIVGNSSNMTQSDEGDNNDGGVESVMAFNAKEVESILSQMRKASSLNSANENSSGSNSVNVKVLTSSDIDSNGSKCAASSGKSDSVNDSDHSTKFVNESSEKSNNGPNHDVGNTGMPDNESNSEESFIPKISELITGERMKAEQDLSSEDASEGKMIDVIDVMKNLDREFNQQKTRGTRGGPNPRFINRGRGLLPLIGPMGRGDRFPSPHSPRGPWTFGGPMFNSPRGRGRVLRGAPPYIPTGRGFRGPNPNRGRNWYGGENWF